VSSLALGVLLAFLPLPFGARLAIGVLAYLAAWVVLVRRLNPQHWLFVLSLRPGGRDWGALPGSSVSGP
jgi:hypothetical protein